MDLDAVMTTTFAARAFTDDDVPDATIAAILDKARFAPSGGNRQGWRVIVVRDRDARRQLARLAEPTMRRYLAQARAGESPWNTIDPTTVRDADIAAAPDAGPAVAPIVDAPVLLVIGVDLRVVASFDSELDRVGVISGASIYPFVWNILLQARNHGLGGVLTTYVAPREAEAQALLGMPQHVAIAALVPIGRPVRQLTRLRRNPVSDFAMRDRWDGPRLPDPA